jgi:hypothetical protein
MTFLPIEQNVKEKKCLLFFVCLTTHLHSLFIPAGNDESKTQYSSLVSIHVIYILFADLKHPAIRA